MIPIARPSLGKEELKNVKKVFDTYWLGMGSFVYEFEKKIRNYLGAKHAITVNTGTTAIHIALSCIGIGPGDEVIVPSYTFVSTVNAFILRGAKPIFVDIRENTLNIDETKIEEKITDRTKAIFPVHYAGVACEMDTIMTIARRYNLFVVL